MITAVVTAFMACLILVKSSCREFTGWLPPYDAECSLVAVIFAASGMYRAFIIQICGPPKLK